MNDEAPMTNGAIPALDVFVAVVGKGSKEVKETKEVEGIKEIKETP